MKLHIHVADIRETVEVVNADDALKKFKAEAARRAPFLLRGVINGMSELKFAAEAVKRHNGETGDRDPAPQSAQQFLDWAQQRGYVTVED
jgi:hypothetical protein